MAGRHMAPHVYGGPSACVTALVCVTFVMAMQMGMMRVRVSRPARGLHKACTRRQVGLLPNAASS